MPMPHKISCEARANLLVRQARKIICMGMLGENVAALRAANQWSLQELAARVQQAGAKNVKYQHIQQLEARPNTSPRYIVELAKAFGKSVEDLRTWEEGMPSLGPNFAVDGERLGVREDAPAFSRKRTPQEVADQSLLEDFRACSAEVQQALRLIIAASRAKSGRSAI